MSVGYETLPKAICIGPAMLENSTLQRCDASTPLANLSSKSHPEPI